MNSCIFLKKSIFGKTCDQIQQRDASTYQQSEKEQIQVTIKVFLFFLSNSFIHSATSCILFKLIMHTINRPKSWDYITC